MLENKNKNYKIQTQYFCKWDFRNPKLTSECLQDVM